MASWKKVIVSGSNISQLNNDSGYLIVTDTIDSASVAAVATTLSPQATASIADRATTASFADLAGSARSADSASVAARATTLSTDATASFALVAGTARNADSASVAARATELSADATASFADLASSARSADSASVADNATTASFASSGDGVFSGSFSGSFSGDGSGLTGLASSLDIAGDSGTDTLDLLTDTLTVAGTSNEITTAVTDNTITISLPDDVTIGQDLTVSRDATITRNLTVLGTASFQNTTDLDVADRFIRLASGSNANGDGGIVIQQDGPANGEAFAFDSATSRWGITGSFDPTDNVIVPDAFMATVVEGGAAEDPEEAPARYTKKGNTFVADNGDIYIYS